MDFTPALVVEILSPSTASKYKIEKMELYQLQQIKYYIIVDTMFKKIEIYQFTARKYALVAITPETYLFNFEEDGCKFVANFLTIWD